MTTLATSALERAEAIKQTKKVSTAPAPTAPSTPKHNLKANTSQQTNCDLNKIFTDIKLDSTAVPLTGQSSNKHIVNGQSSYTKEEIAVLRYTSIINGREYLALILKKGFPFRCHSPIGTAY